MALFFPFFSRNGSNIWFFLLHFPKISHEFYVRGNKQPPPVDCFFFSKNTFNYKLQHQVKYIPQCNQNSLKSKNIRVLSFPFILFPQLSTPLAKAEGETLNSVHQLPSYRMTPFWRRRNKPSPLPRPALWSLSYKLGDQFSGVRCRQWDGLLQYHRLLLSMVPLIVLAMS